MKRENIEYLKSLLMKYTNNFKVSDEINVKWLQRVLEVNLNVPVPENLIIKYLTEKGFINIVFNTIERKISSNNNFTDEDHLQDKKLYNFKIENKELKKEDKVINEENIQGVTGKGNLEELNQDDEEEDFDPELFLKENEATIRKTVFQTNSFEDNSLLIRSYQENKDMDLLNEIVRKNTGLVEKSASFYYKNAKHKLDHDDLVSIGMFGLLKAIDEFDPDKGYQFSTYALHWIRQKITRAIMNEGSTIRIPVHLHEQIKKLIQKENECFLNFKFLNIDWVCKELNVTKEKYYELKRIDTNFLNLTSLHTLVSKEGDESLLIDFIEYIPEHSVGADIALFHSPYEQLVIKDTKVKLESVLLTLKEREREVIKHRFGFYGGETKTLEEVGMIYGVTRERIRQIEAKTIRKLRARIVKKKLKYLDLIP
ncbi:RNA polymerase sigma factor RpoD/SigA [Evansella clarkii]|uniref:sigma-70 family RNA polymerase sigma factor n=1 Tax=Evansella clarkii TaxID=79879 RepID=UPI000B448378|nr:sigma-70 family RNA polymerase sigma factor [Evansella clarkii]